MDIAKRIIDEVAAKMLDNQIVMEDISIVPNVFLIYLHRDDHAGIRFLLKTLREQIIVRLNKEIAKREKKAAPNAGKFSKILDFFAGFSVFGDKHQLIAPNEWDISFQATDRDVLVGDEIFEIGKGEICVVANYSDSKSADNNLASHLRTFVTIFKTDDAEAKNFVLETAKPIVNDEFSTNIEMESPTFRKDTLAILTCKYANKTKAETYEMNKDSIIVGREKTCDFVLREASDRISRKHFEINYRQGEFFLKSFGIYGTTLQGKPVPLTEKVVENTTKELNKEIEIPEKARIALAGGEILIDFLRKVK